jgi:hypothetical protein
MNPFEDILPGCAACGPIPCTVLLDLSIPLKNP